MKFSDVLILKKSKLIDKFEGVQLGTQTITEVRKEATDKDPSSINNGTETFTKSKGEATDSDR